VYSLPVVKQLLIIFLLHAVAACSNTSPTGNVAFLKRVADIHGDILSQWTPVRQVSVHLLDPATGQKLATTQTNNEGNYSFGEIALPTNFRVEIEARILGPRINVWVNDGSVDKVPYRTRSDTGKLKIRIEEPYLAGAFNIVDLNLQLATLMDGLVDNSPPKLLEVSWGPNNAPYCGSCYFEDQHLLDLAGTAGEEDGHDDSVVLHEFGHYVEFTWGLYDNPTGAHNLEYVIPTLAWSEGFATWLQGAIRQDPIYVDRRPNESIYSLDLETPPDSTKGTLDGQIESKLSEALVYGLLWDLSDAGDGDDDVADYSREEVLEVVLALKDGPDLGVGGADLVDFLNLWQCAHPSTSDLNTLHELLMAVDFPYETLPEPLCPST